MTSTEVPQSLRRRWLGKSGSTRLPTGWMFLFLFCFMFPMLLSTLSTFPVVIAVAAEDDDHDPDTSSIPTYDSDQILNVAGMMGRVPLPFQAIIDNNDKNTSDVARRVHAVMVLLPLRDHILPMTALAGELLRRKHTVTLFMDDNGGWCHWMRRTLARMNASAKSVSASASPSRFTCVSLPSAYTELQLPPAALDTFVWDDTVAGSRSYAHVLAGKVLTGAGASSSSPSMGFHPTYTSTGSQALLDLHHMQLETYIKMAAVLRASGGGPNGRVSFVMGDTLAFVASSVAKYLRVPFVGVHLAGHAHLPFDVSPTAAAPGSGFPPFVRGTRNRLANLVVQFDAIANAAAVLERVNAARSTYGIEPIRTPWDVYGLRSMMLVPSIWGAPWHQRFCGNVHVVGSLTLSGLAPMEPTPGWNESRAMLSTLDKDCEGGTVYIHLASMPLSRAEALAFIRTTAIALQDVSDLLERERRRTNQSADLHRPPLCAVWSLAMNTSDGGSAYTSRVARALDVVSQYGETFAVRNHFVDATYHRFHSTALLHHPKTALFVTDCSTAAVSMGLASGVPMIGVPVMHRHGDTCARLAESAFGRAVRLTSRAEHLFTAVVSLARASGAGPRHDGACWMISNTTTCERRRTHFRSLLHQLHLESSGFLGGAERAVDLVEQRYLNGLLDCMPSRPPQHNATECTYFESCAYVEATWNQTHRRGLVYAFWRNVGPVLAMDAPASWYWTIALLCDLVPSAAELLDHNHLPAILLVCVLSAWWFYVLLLLRHIVVRSAHHFVKWLVDTVRSIRCLCMAPFTWGSSVSHQRSQQQKAAASTISSYTSLRATVIPRRSQSEHARPSKTE